MKVILTGPTGFIGAEVLSQCIRNPAITSIVALSRRELPSSEVNKSSLKLKVIIHEDYTSYPDNLLRELAGAEACIWSLGNVSTAQKLELKYTLAAANAFENHLAPKLDAGKKFRFIYLSGMLSVRDQEKPLWFIRDARRIKGEVENELIHLTAQPQSATESYIIKPWMVLKKEGGTMAHGLAMLSHVGLGYTIWVNELAAVMINTALKGSKVQIMENDALGFEGRKLLKGSGRK